MKVGLSIKPNRPTLKNEFFRLVELAATVSMPCVHIRHLKLYVSRKFDTYFSLGGMNEWNFKVSYNDSTNKNIVILLCQ